MMRMSAGMLRLAIQAKDLKAAVHANLRQFAGLNTTAEDAANIHTRQPACACVRAVRDLRFGQEAAQVLRVNAAIHRKTPPLQGGAALVPTWPHADTVAALRLLKNAASTTTPRTRGPR